MESLIWRVSRRGACALFAAILLLTPVLLAGQSTDYKIEPSLLKKLADDEQATAALFVVFAERPNLAPAWGMKQKAARVKFVVKALQDAANRSQGGVRGYLKAAKIDYRSFWIENRIYIPHGTLELARSLAQRHDVAALVGERVLRVPQPDAASFSSTQGIEWNITQIGADQVWSTYGKRGQGIVVANIDTGVQYDHPALVRQYRGNTGSGFNHTGNWYDPTKVCGATPCDNEGHGTHTMGTMVGDDGAGNQIGVAPAAQWIACKGCRTNSCYNSDLIACAQWILSPGGAGPPDVVNNSWGGSSSSWYESYVQSWAAAGIFPAFSIGNSGPGCSTAGSPGDYPESFASGATTNTDAIASFSSRGPSSFGAILKPDVAAPGTGIRSSVPTNSYQQYSGTSMASPHSAGTVALLWSINPAYIGNIPATAQLVESTAVKLTSTDSCGTTPAGSTPNNTYGYGRLAAKAAADGLGTVPNQPPAVTITSPSNGAAYQCPVTVQFTASVSDPNNDTVSTTWTDNGSPLGSGTSLAKSYDCTQAATHNIVAVATDSHGATSSSASTFTISDPNIPPAPANLTAANVSGSAVLNWSYGSNPTSFRLDRKQQTGKNWSAWQTITTGVSGASRGFTDNPGNGTYQYQVYAITSCTSGPSNAASVRVK